MRALGMAMLVGLSVLGWSEPGGGHDRTAASDVRVAAGSGADVGHGGGHRWRETIAGWVGSPWETGGMSLAACLALILGYRAIRRRRRMHGKIPSMRASGRCGVAGGPIPVRIRTPFEVSRYRSYIPEARHVAERPQAHLSPEERYEAAYRLACKGWSLRDIARELGISQREVDLVINL